ncbi:Limonene 1,2-monooxygenase [compost metagenome]
MIPFSILDLAPVVEGSTPAEALHHSLDLAQHAERLGYHRYWLAEHHNMPGIASAATALVIGYVAQGTRTIRVGAGGIMLPNHAPLVIAEQFGTLAALYPGRIDLGLGRAPGTDQRTARALRRSMVETADTYPQDVMELRGYFQPAVPGQAVRAVPGAGLEVPIWLLGSSLSSARLAAAWGLPFAFASHFAPAQMMAALQVYRDNFQPSEALAAPYAMLGLNAFAADTDAEARRLFTSVQQQFVRLQRGTPGQLPPPVESMDGHWTPWEAMAVEQALSCSVVGSRETVERGLAEFIARTGADELMLTGMMYDHAARLRSMTIVAEAHQALAATRA